MGKAPEAYELKLGTRITASRFLNNVELTALLDMPDAQVTAVKQALKAYLEGEITKMLIINRVNLMDKIMGGFDKQWDQVITQYQERNNMARCGDCNKMVSLDVDTDPEETSATLSFSGDADDKTRTADYDVDIRIVNTCADCGNELKEANFNMSGSFDIDCSDFTEDDMVGWSIEVEGLSRTERGGENRYSKKYYGFEGDIVLRDSGNDELERVNVGEDMQASGMDEI